MKTNTEIKEENQTKTTDCSGHVEPVVSSELAHVPNIDEALSQAVKAIYFNDSSDYLQGLWEVVRALGGEDACKLLKENESKAFHKYAK